MIISASYKTDIPAFYGDWFINRLRAGYCKMANPYNKRAIKVPLRREDVDGIVFWTKNIGPFLEHLSEIRERGYPFTIQYAINGYPRAFESSVVDAVKSVEHVQRISAECGPRVCVWRYDTIIVSSLTPIEFHLHNFERIASALRGAVDEVVVSFMQLYKKTARHMNEAACCHGFRWEDPTCDEKRTIISNLAEIAAGYGMQLAVCAQREYLVPGVKDASCIDVKRLSDVAGVPVYAPQKGGRSTCGCFASRDIGEYDTCPHGCIYCYAVSSPEKAKKCFREHDPEGEFLFKGLGVKDASGDEGMTSPQLPLF